MPFIALDPAVAAPAPVTTLGAPRVNYGLTLADLSAELSKMLGRRDDVDSDRLELYVNLGYVDLVTSIETGETDGSLMLDLVAEQPLYMLPDVVAAILSMAVVDPEETIDYGGRIITPIDIRSYRMSRVALGKTQQYFRHGDMLVAYPTPEFEGEAVIDFRMRPVFMTDPTHSPFLGVEWHEGVLLAARWKMFAALLEVGMAISAQNDYVNFMRRRVSMTGVEKQQSVGRSEVIRSERQLTRRPATRWP